MFGFIKQVFISALMYFANLSSVNSLECISLKNHECRVRPKIVNINSNYPIFHPFSIKVNKCNGNCNNTNDPYARICVPDTVKNLNVKVFNLMTLANETRHRDIENSMRRVNAYVGWTTLFVIVNNNGIKINVDANVKN